MSQFAGEITAILSAAIAAFHGGRLDEARRGCRLVLSALPAHGTTLSLLGATLGRDRAPSESIDWLRRAVAAEPANSQIHNTLGNVLADIDAAGASVSYRCALALAPDFAHVHYNLGNREPPDRRRGPLGLRFRRAASLDPGFVDAWLNLSAALGATDAAAAQAAARTALAIHPSDPRAWLAAGVVSLRLCQPHHAVIADERVLAIEPDDRGGWINLLTAIHYDPLLSTDQVFATIRRWAAKVERATSVLGATTAADPEKRLRIGYLSADLRAHVVARTIGELIRHHDDRAFELFLYAIVADPDEVTQRMARHGTLRSVLPLTDADAASLIRSDRIDILVSVAGHTSGNRPAIAAHLPAPVQISLYDLSTTGLKAMTGWITDGILHPPTTREGFVERLLRLPSWYLRLPPADSPPPSPPSTGPVTFGCFNSTAKLSDAVFDAWARILVATPQSRLHLGYRDNFCDPAVLDRIRRRLAQHGLAADRLAVTESFLSAEEHFARITEVDIALDTFPFNGANTTFEALWMGVPVVTLAGERFIGRMGASILTAIGEPSLVAASVDEYVDIATALARDRDRLARLRQELRPRLLSSPICDAERYARTVEAEYRRLWREWCSEQPPTAC